MRGSSETGDLTEKSAISPVFPDFRDVSVFGLSQICLKFVHPKETRNNYSLDMSRLSTRYRIYKYLIFRPVCAGYLRDTYRTGEHKKRKQMQRMSGVEGWSEVGKIRK
jgi:hypothetical protein